MLSGKEKEDGYLLVVFLYSSLIVQALIRMPLGFHFFSVSAACPVAGTKQGKRRVLMLSICGFIQL